MINRRTNARNQKGFLFFLLCSIPGKCSTMKKLLVFMLFILAGYSQAEAQIIKRECSSKMRKLAGKKVDSTLLQQRRQALRMTATTPYIIKLFVVIFANSDGSHVAASQADVRRQIANMSTFYAPHNICFILSATQQVNNSDLNNQDADNEEDDLSPYVRDNHITVFVHNDLFGDDGGLNGNAYGIPNNYLSIAGSAISSTDNISTLAHEMGHCFGLYHTFEDANGVENVARSGGCRNCEDNGDYLCDTQADRDTDPDFINANNCTYTGLRRDDCGSHLLMEPENIMTYGRRAAGTISPQRREAVRETLL